MSDSSSQHGMNLATAAVLLLTGLVLYVGREIFVPFALAILLSFLLAPPVAWLRRVRMPRVAAVVLVVVSAVALIGGVSFLVGSQALGLASNLPLYQESMQQKIRAMRSSVPGSSAFNRSAEALQELGRDISEAAGAATATKNAAAGRAQQEPLPVRVEPAAAGPLQTLQQVLGPLLKPVGTAGLVIVFVFFVLLAPSDLRDRFIRLAGSDLHRTTEALSEAASRVSRYLLMQLVVNATYGIPLGIGLYLLNVPGAMLWAFLAMLLRFIPYLGPVIAAVFPLTLAFVVDPGWSMLLWTTVLILVLELASNNIIEPWLYGSSTGMTPMAVIISAIFWTLLWGPMGLILATPLTVCLVVMGRYVPRLAFIDVLLGSDPVLSPEERLYQRLLAGDIEEAIELAETELAASSLLQFYDGVALPVLRLAESARESGSSSEDRQKVAEGLRVLVLDLQEILAKQDDQAAQALPAATGGPVLCIAGRRELDAAAAMLLAHVLESRGIATRLLPAAAIGLDAIASLDLTGVKAVCLSYLNPRPRTYARFVARRLKSRARQLNIVLGAWNLAPDALSENLAAEAGVDALASTIAEAAGLLQELSGQATGQSATEAPPRAEQAAVPAANRPGTVAGRIPG